MTTRKVGFKELMKAVYNRLDTHNLTKNYSIYNYVPRDASFPYISLGPMIGARSGSFSARDYPAEENVITIHVWSDYKGDKEAAEMIDNIVQAMTSSPLSFDSYTELICLFDYADIMIDDTEPAKPIRHGVVRFRIHMA